MICCILLHTHEHSHIYNYFSNNNNKQQKSFANVLSTPQSTQQLIKWFNIFPRPFQLEIRVSSANQ